MRSDDPPGTTETGHGFDPVTKLIEVQQSLNRRSPSMSWSIADVIQGAAAWCVDEMTSETNKDAAPSLLQQITFGRKDACHEDDAACIAQKCPETNCDSLPKLHVTGDVKAHEPHDRRLDLEATAKALRADLFNVSLGSFTEADIVALLGAHTVGMTRNQFGHNDGPWTNTPFVFNNDYFLELKQVNERKDVFTRKFDNFTVHTYVPHPFSTDFQNWWQSGEGGTAEFPVYGFQPGVSSTRKLFRTSRNKLMLDVDMALEHDRHFQEHVLLFARDEQAFLNCFQTAFLKMSEIGRHCQ